MADCFGKRIYLGTEIMQYNAAVKECELKITWEERSEANENST